MGSSNPRLSVPRDPPVWCEAETGSAVNMTPELPAEQEETLSKHGRRRAVINPHPRMVGRSGRLGAATRVVPQRFVFRLCLLVRQRRFFYWRKIFDFSAKRLAACCQITALSFRGGEAAVGIRSFSGGKRIAAPVCALARNDIVFQQQARPARRIFRAGFSCGLCPFGI